MTETHTLSYRGYHERAVPGPDLELTSTDPGTPMGELMRRHWQAVCLSSQLTDVPFAASWARTWWLFAPSPVRPR